MMRWGFRVLALAGLMTTAGLAAGPAALSDAAAPAAAPNSIRNPVRESAADPYLVYTGGFYYLTYTRGDRLVVVKAASVTGLQAAPETTVWTPSAGAACCNLWAPELHQLDGKWYLYYTADNGTDANHRMWVLEATNPLGPYTSKGQLNTGNFHSIDGSVLTLPDGRRYFTWASGRSDGQHVFIASMSNPWTTTSAPVQLINPDQAWEQHNARVTEAPVQMIHDGKVFLAYSGSHCNSPDYAVGLMRFNGGDPLNPGAWTKLPGPAFHRDDAAWVWGTGHNGFFTSPDGTETWIIYHGVTSSSGAVYGSCGGDRAARIGKVTFDANGTPVLGTPKASWQSLTLPSGDPGATVVADGIYKVLPKNNTGNALDVAACSTADGANVALWNDLGNECQKWQLTYLGDGTYQFLSKNSGKSLDVAGCSPDNHADVIQWTYHGGDCQRWYLDAEPGGFYRVISKIGGKSLDVDGCSTQPGADVRTWPYWQGDCQKWKLVKVG